MIDLSLIQQIIVYVIHAPFFWQSMGFTSAIAMFVGAAIFDGHLEQAKKGIVAVSTYAFMLLWVTFLRVNDTITNSIQPTHFQMAYAGISTIFLISIFWLFGILFGVFLLSIKEKKKDKKL